MCEEPRHRGRWRQDCGERTWSVYRNFAEVMLRPPCMAGWGRPSPFVTAKSESPSPPSRAQTRSGASFGLPKDLSLLLEQCLHFNLQRIGPIQRNEVAGAQSVFWLIAHLSLHPRRHNGSDNRLSCFHVMPSIRHSSLDVVRRYDDNPADHGGQVAAALSAIEA